ncbi:CMGC/DYRK/DYRK2 protein kinase [Mucor circinelloides 1006PhL]|uniref:dual-specificity kinase n=1 Tax=Mucor circinelloides f. circinelloides (strain 1006PhL) TaxID=1220926 RepID=S2JPI7_MUCC1|nr:CMGC/DYRK/DYRK2 protein kinase [Mucor circinelloides 1006PhL]
MSDHSLTLDSHHHVNHLDSTEKEEAEKEGRGKETHQGEESVNQSESDNRRESVNLLDMTEFPSVQPNVINQKQSRDSLIGNDQSNANLLDKNSNNKPLNTSLHKFDPLQKSTKSVSSGIGESTVVDTKSSGKSMPTRLPTPRRPVSYTHLSTDSIHSTPTTTAIQPNHYPTIITTTATAIPTAVASAPSIQLGPTPPSSPGRRVRHTSIARLVKPLPRELGKANRELAEFDPLISPVRDAKMIPVIDDSKEDLLTLSPTIIPSKKGAHHTFSTEQPSIIGDLMKQQQQEKTSIKQCSSNTRIPLPKSIQQQQQPSNKMAPDETPQQIQEPAVVTRSTAVVNQVPNIPPNTTTTATPATKLRKPEVIVPKSIKRLPSNPRKEISVNYTRRPSFPTNDIVQDQLDKERENSRRLSANLISAQGLITQPDDITDNHSTNGIAPVGINRTASHDARMEKIHDRLQCLVDVRIPSENEEQQQSDEPVIHEYKKEHGNTEVMSAKTALNKYRPFLSPFEKTEIMRYPAIYYVGSHAKKHQASTDETAHNYGYDDDKGDYHIAIKDHLNYRYEIIESLGKGSFGQVVKCKDHKIQGDQSFVAVKIIRNKKRFHAQAQTEVRILEKLTKWDPKNKHYNVRMMDSFYFRDHLCIVFECLSLNLYEILQQNSYQGFSMGLVKRFAFQILTCLKLLSEHNVIHCDLKPENILLKQPDRSGIRVIDYGSSCYANEKVYTYIQSRFYRAPEVILGLDYGLPIDMWSTGCILAELYTGKPLFPGENEPDQLACIMQLLGVPSKDYLDRCTRKKQFFDMYDQPRKSINSKGKKRRPNSLTFTEALRRSTYDNFDRDFGDFISKCLTWEPDERLKPHEALSHPWIQAMKK